MAIRIRKIGGHTIAVCAACTKPKVNDIYLDDAAHGALSAKFGLDFYHMGFLTKPLVDKDTLKLMEEEENEKTSQLLEVCH